VTLYLASRSPRRYDLLKGLGVKFTVLPTDVDEGMQSLESAEDYVSRLARNKAAVGLDILAGRGESGALVIGSDTAVVVDRGILGKPSDRDDFIRMMEQLSGRAHDVVTAVAIASHDLVEVEVVTSRVVFAEVTPEHIRAYWKTGEPVDKAGGYAVQGLASVFIKRIEGSYSAIVGLPLRETAQLLTRRGVEVWNGALMSV